MRVLLVSKTTNFELHGETLREKIRAGLNARAVLDLMAQDHSDHTQTLNDLSDALAKAGADVRHIGRSQHWPSAFKADMVMTVGGDGTLLAASHHLGKDDKIMGFKSSRSSVGYLCLGDRTMIPEVVKRLFSNTLAYVSVARLCAKVTRAGAADAIVSEPVLNDILFVNANPASTTRYMIHHGNDCEEHRSSGIWFSTAIGSSAGIRAAGGERVPSTARLFQYRVRELYRPTGSRLHLAGGFFEENSGLRVQNFNESGLLALDGQHGAIELSYGDEFVVTSAPPIQIASLPEAAPSKSLGFLGANFAST